MCRACLGAAHCSSTLTAPSAPCTELGRLRLIPGILCREFPTEHRAEPAQPPSRARGKEDLPLQPCKVHPSCLCTPQHPCSVHPCTQPAESLQRQSLTLGLGISTVISRVLVHPALQLEIQPAPGHAPSFVQMAISPLSSLSAPDPVLSKLVTMQQNFIRQTGRD